MINSTSKQISYEMKMVLFIRNYSPINFPIMYFFLQILSTVLSASVIGCKFVIAGMLT